MTLHDEVEEFKDMAGIGRQARPYKERTSVLAPHSATIYELLFSEQLTIYQVWQFLCRRRGLRGIAYSTVRRFVRERQKFCVHGIIGARQTGASNEHEHQTQFS